MPPKRAAKEKEVVRLYPSRVIAQKRRAAAFERAAAQEQDRQAKKKRKERAEYDDAAKMRLKREKSGQQSTFIQQPGHQGRPQQRLKWTPPSDDEDEMPKNRVPRFKDDLSLKRNPGLVLKDEEAKPSVATVVFDMHGAEIGVPPSLYRIQQFLRQRGASGAASVKEILEGTAIDLSDERNAPFVNRLEACDTIVTVSKSPLEIKIAAPYGVECRADLVDLFERRLPMGDVKSEDGVVQDTIDEKELIDAYHGVVADIDHLVKQGRMCDAIVRGCSRVLFPSVPGKKVGSMQTWTTASTPSTASELRTELEKIGLREEKPKPKSPFDLFAQSSKKNKEVKPTRKDRVAAMASEPTFVEIVRCPAKKPSPSASDEIVS